jgi:hypothetical protein
VKEKRNPNERKPHPLDQSVLYKITSIGRLVSILKIDRKLLNYLLSSSENYIRFTNDRNRDIEWPKPSLRRTQKRVADLLSRIKTPDFLHSAKRGKSYITNAACHNAAYPSVKVDIQKFFKAVRAPAVFHFFRDKMQCEPDVAFVLTKLLTVDRHLPTGGNTSPILSYFAYMDMFSEINEVAEQHGCVMTCLMDDMTFTGTGATRNLIFEVRRILRRYRLWAHKMETFKARQARIITGVAVTVGGLRLPNKRQLAIKCDMSELAKAKSDEERLNVLKRAIGRMREAALIDKRWHPRATALVAKRRAIAKRVMQNTLAR